MAVKVGVHILKMSQMLTEYRMIDQERCVLYAFPVDMMALQWLIVPL